MAAICWFARVLSWDGAIAAAVVGAAVWEAGGWPWVAPLIAFFLTSTALTLVGKRRKEAMSIDSRPRRSIQVLANGGPAAACAALYIWQPDPALALAMLASLAAANADTWATEIGSLLGTKPFRIITMTPTVPGESGAVTVVGLFAAFLGAAAIAATAPLLEMTRFIGVISVVGFFGCLLDSVLGDGVQARYLRDDGSFAERGPGRHVSGWRWMTNDTVNFLSTTLAAGAGYWIGR